ncbi:hypothetical protein NDU88_006249, partial [Pleurodeles waltl]
LEAKSHSYAHCKKQVCFLCENVMCPRCVLGHFLSRALGLPTQVRYSFYLETWGNA